MNSEEEDDTTLPGPDNEEDEVVFLDGDEVKRFKREKYIDEVKDITDRIRKNPR